MCNVSTPPLPPPPRPPSAPRLVDAAVIKARLRGEQDLARGGFIGTITNPQGVSGPASVLQQALVGAQP
jgi:hypothetical protein